MAYSQVYILRCQTQKISATVKNSGKKFAKIIPRGPALQLHRADYTMVYGSNLSPLVAAEVQRVLAFGRKGTDSPQVYHRLQGLQTLPSPGTLLIRNHLPVILPFKMEETVDIVKEYISPRVTSLHPDLHELNPHMRQTDLMVRILIPIRFQLITDEEIGVVTVRHEELQLGII